MPDGEPAWLKFRVWLEAGQTPRFIFPNGPYESRASVIEVNRRYQNEFDPKTYRAGVSRAHILREGALPHIRIGEIKVHGPIQEPGGSKELVAIFGPEGIHPETALEQLYGFAARAYRRPLHDGDRSSIAAMYQQGIDKGSDARRSALDTIKLILCSPSFLYLSEITDPDDGRLTAHDLAARLSYALWAAPPDEALTADAMSGRLLETEMLASHIDRMIRDPRSEQFIRGFLDSWLGLREIGNQPPPRRSAREYYAEDLPSAMKREPRLFFRHLLDDNASAMRLLTAEYTFVDKRLAALYQLPERKTLRLSDGFQRVRLRDDSQRGGLLGMASVLTASANGVETSPVTRGVWVSENLLGVTPPAPPDDVPALEANVSGAKTIREKLALHRQAKTCAGCHRKIDPLGFGLENFDPIGRWRSNYPKSQGRAQVDASGKLPSGESYSDFASYRETLAAARGEQFARNLIEKLLTYATGRHMERADQFEIDDLAQQAQRRDYALKDMLIGALTSEIFRTR